MSKEFSVEEKLLLNLLSEELPGKTGEKGQEYTDWKKLFERADRHRVLALLYNTIEAAEFPVEEKKRWMKKVRGAVLQSYHLLFTAKFVVELLEKNNISCVLLKGVTIACCYGTPELRKAGDVDILLLDIAQKEHAERLLTEAGFKKSNEQHASHHTVWFSPENIEVEIHTRIIEKFTQEKANRKMDELFSYIPEHIHRKDIMGVDFPVLRDGYQAYHLLLHMLVHYLHSGFGLRLLCDWVAFWNREISEAERKEYRRLVKESGLQKFSDMITSVCVHFLGLAEPGLGTCIAREKTEEFLAEVLEAEEFGASDSDRLLILNETGIKAYIREFHHQMKMNYPKLGKVFLLWPVLWICTLVRFVTNNHKIRGTTSWKVLKKTQERSKNIKELQLFQKM